MDDRAMQDIVPKIRIWPREDDFYSNKVFITETGTLTLCWKGYCVEKPLEEWVKMAWPEAGSPMIPKEPK